MSFPKIPVTVVILTHNEAANIVPCVESVDAFGEVIVVDSGSTDGTVELIRERFPQIRVLHHAFEDFGRQRNWALDHADPRHEWILFLDADERCAPECAAAIDAAVADPSGHAGFFLCCRNMFLGRWIRHCTMYPTWQLRLLRHGRVRYQKEGHGQREVMDGSAGYISAPYDHLGFSKGVKEWISRHNEYSSNEIGLLKSLAEGPVGLAALFSRDPVQRHRTVKRLSARTPFRAVVVFIYLYIVRRGFLDGRPGLLFCLLRVANELHMAAKLAELDLQSGVTTRAGRAPRKNEVEPAVMGVDGR